MGLILLERHDAFISYARDDNLLCDEAVSQFRRFLKDRFEAEMRRRLELPPSAQADIVMDRTGLPSNGALTHELERAVQNSTFLFIFIGQSYPRSSWCSKELEAFIKRFHGGRSEALERTFVIVLERKALTQRWGNFLEEPERPIYEEFFDSATGVTIPFVLEGPEGQAYPSHRLTQKMRRIVSTMADRAGNLPNRVFVTQ